MTTIDSEAKDKRKTRLHNRRKRRRSKKKLINSNRKSSQLLANKPSPLLNIAVSHQVVNPTSPSAEEDNQHALCVKLA